jgi:protein-disulfide isomerase
VLEKYPKEVKLVHKFTPLHGFSPRAAAAALAANDQGKFWDYSARLYEHQKNLDDARLIAIAIDLKLDLNRFRNKLHAPEYKQMIDRDLADAFRFGITGTPYVFVNGVVMSDRSFNGLTTAIDSELKKQ